MSEEERLRKELYKANEKLLTAWEERDNLRDKHATLVEAAGAVVDDHKRLCSTWQKCSHDVVINALRKALENDG
jgi:hypothetical protein